MLPRWAQSGKLWVHPIPHPGRNNGGAEIRAGRPQTPLARIQAPSSVALNRTWWIPAHPELRYLHWPSHPLVLWDRHGQTAEIRAARLTIYPRLWNLPSPIRLFTVEELTCWQLYQGMCFTKM